MIAALLTGLIIGFLMCIPIGPINVWVMSTQIKRSSAKALSIAIGGSCMDFVYFYIILNGLTLIQLSSSLTNSIKWFGILAIFILGAKEFYNASKPIQLSQEKETPSGMLAGFLVGIVLYTSNPTLIVTMSGLGAFVKSLDFFMFNQVNMASISAGLAVGSFLWFFLLVKLTARYQETIRRKYLKHFMKISGVLMMSLSAFMTYKFNSME